jgi:hypothetical protein
MTPPKRSPKPLSRTPYQTIGGLATAKGDHHLSAYRQTVGPG